MRITGLATTGTDERDPWLTSDGLSLYYSHQVGAGDSDIYRSVRTKLTDPFPAGTVVSSVSRR